MASIFKRTIKSGLQNFRRGGIISFASVLVITITLSVITMLFLLQAVLNFSLTQIKDKVDVSIYFIPGANENRILDLKDSLEQLPEVKEVIYVSSTEALSDFRERHESDYPTIAALDEIDENPLGAYLNVRAKEISQYENIANFLKSDDALVIGSLNIVDKINYYQNKDVIERLNKIIKGVEELGFIITFIFIIIALTITYNTIRLTIFISKEEIGVMRLVGASKTRIRGPFIVEGIIYGTISALITIFIFLFATFWMGNNMSLFLGIDLFEYYTSNFFQMIILIFISGILLGIVSSLLAIRKYLKK